MVNGPQLSRLDIVNAAVGFGLVKKVCVKLSFLQPNALIETILILMESLGPGIIYPGNTEPVPIKDSVPN